MLNFEVSADPKYRNDCYGVLAALKYNPAPDEYKYVLKAFKDEEEFTAFCAKDDSGKYKQDPDLKEILLVFRGAFVGDMRYPVTENGKVVGYRYYSAVSKETIKDGKATVDQTVTINNCLDFEAGTMSVYYENYKGTEAAAKNSAILCEFDGKLYTSVERTSVWTGMAALTKLEQGRYKNFGLIHYNHFGERVSSQATPITLIWPNIYSYGQKLAGMVFKLAYGQFGYMEKDGKELGRVVAFSASLNLSFMKSPQQEDDTAVPDTYFGRMKELWTDWRGASLYQYAYHGNRFNKLTDINMNDSKEDHDKAQEGVAASVMVPDILFGCGKGFVGLHFKVELAIQNMIDSLPKIKGSLEVNTIGDWSFGLDGMCKLSTFSLEASLKFKSKDNIPIPDELFFFVSVPKPGTNIDGCGTLWLLGAGGGVSNIYDTIFMTSGVPPLKLILQASFSIVQILDAKARLELSLTALKLTATDLKFAGTIEVIRSITLGLQWYPDLNLQASIYVDMFEKTISGNGYIVLIGKNYKEWEFEMFARVRLKIPESVPAVGGMTLLGIDVGIGTKKVWGAFEAICVSLGVSYYWGEKGVRFGTGGNFAQPSYPNLLTQGYDGDCTDFPIGYDPEEDRILYARFGTNLDPPVGARILSDDALLLQGAGDPAIGSNMTKTLHKINVGEYDEDNNASALVQVSFPAADLDAAKAIAGNFTLKDSSENELPLTYAQDVPEQGANESDEDYEARVAPICATNMAANANISWGDGTATLGFTLTNSTQFNKDWYLTTGTVNAGTGEIESGVAADVVMYNVRPLPGITSLDATIEVDGNSNEYVDLIPSGNYGDLDKISFYLTKGNTDPLEDGIPLGVYDDLRNPPMLYLPVDLPTGDYFVRAVYSAEDLVNGVVWSSNTIHYDNPNTPAAMGTVTAAPCGDLKYGITIPATDDANTTGYIVEVLNADGTPTELSETRVDKADDGKATVFEVGGAISMEVAADPGNPDSGKETVTQGLTAGQSYKLRITPYKAIEAKEPIYEYDTYNNIEVVSEPGNNAAVLYGNSFTTEAMLLPEPQPPVVTVTCGDQTLTSVAQAQKLDKADGTLNALTFTGSSLTLTVASNQAVTGKWTLDGSEVWGLDGNEAADAPADLNREGTFTDRSTVTITLPNLTEGSHLLTLFGKNAAGDSFAAEYAFDVDTMPPRLMLQSPLNGSPFNADGTVTVSGITDPDCTVHVSVDGGAESTYLFRDPQDTSGSKKLTEDGYFTVDADIPEANSSSFHFVEVWAEDANGNATEHSIIEVSHPGFGKIEEYVLKVDGAIPLGGGISTGNAIAAAQLTLAGKLTEGGEVSYFTINSDLVQWQCYAAEGSASVTPDGILTCDAYTKGYVEARVEVTSGAYRTAVLALGSDTLFGDLNGDNRVNTMDLVRLIKYILADREDPQQTDVVLEASGDLNGDGSTGMQDLVQLKKYLLFENAI